MFKQLPLDLPTRTALGREDYFVSPSNAIALASLERWRDWPNRKMVLTGPEGSGKTHLAHVWATVSDARIIQAVDLPHASISDLATGNLTVEDAQAVENDPTAQEALFHTHNLVLAEGHHLLLTATNAPSRWGLSLPDLKSRMEGTSVTPLDEPDDQLLAAMLTKQFADRQLMPTPEAITYLLRHMERSAAEAVRVVAQMDRRALAEGRKITRKLALEVLQSPDAL
ncbi:MAG: DnaA/Hda family protein [Paracoccaceae bacterium]|nr:DnaA/Hda family protein [Paracoccaceae bacterium]MDG2256936.1 DnaA/Hda family protein [Paracoccaceae bacterium]